jgi:thioredoxin 1
MIMDLTAEEWDHEVLASEEPVIVKFWHEECGWCKQLDPVFEELSSEYEGKARFAGINIRSTHENFHIAIKYGVMTVPTIKIFCKGVTIGEIIGFMAKQDLKADIDRILKGSEGCLERSSLLDSGPDAEVSYIG